VRLGQEDNRYGTGDRIAPQLLADRKTVKQRHPDVEKDEIGLNGGRQGYALFSILVK